MTDEQLTEAEILENRKKVSTHTVRHLWPIWRRQGITNIPEIAKWPTVLDVGDRFKGKPFVCVAPGPSLSKNVKLLHELKGKAIICARRTAPDISPSG